MDNDKTGGDAFPTTEHQHTETGHYPVTRNGMTLRDHFAGLALAALIAKLPLIDKKGEFGVKLNEDEKFDFQVEAARTAYAYADYMIQVRNQQ
jgi:hypothetical protein